MENEVPSMLANSEMTADSPDFEAEYPVLYIRFFFYEDNSNSEREYRPATLVITSDDRFYLLLDRAFYSLKPSEYPYDDNPPIIDEAVY